MRTASARTPNAVTTATSRRRAIWSRRKHALSSRCAFYGRANWLRVRADDGSVVTAGTAFALSPARPFANPWWNDDAQEWDDAAANT